MSKSKSSHCFYHSNSNSYLIIEAKNYDDAYETLEVKCDNREFALFCNDPDDYAYIGTGKDLLNKLVPKL